MRTLILSPIDVVIKARRVRYGNRAQTRLPFSQLIEPALDSVCAD